MAGPNAYSRFVAILKVGLPLVAVAMLAALFLISNDGRTGSELVFSEADLAALGEGLTVTRPVFSGVTDELDRFRFTAEMVTPDAAPPSNAAIDTLEGRIDFAGGPGVDLRAETAALDLEAQRLTLGGAVRMVSQDGYVFAADRVDLDLRAGSMAASGSVEGDGPMGRIDSDRLTVITPEGGGGARVFLFEDAVRLVYLPGIPLK